MGSMDKIQAQLAEAMADHEMDFTYDGKKTGCSCGHWQDRGPVSAEADHADHLASMAAPVVKALLEAQLKTFAGLAAAHDRGRGGCVCPLCLAVAEESAAL